MGYIKWVWTGMSQDAQILTIILIYLSVTLLALFLFPLVGLAMTYVILVAAVVLVAWLIIGKIRTSYREYKEYEVHKEWKDHRGW